MLALLQWLCVIMADIIYSSEAINYTATAVSILAVTAVTVAYATAAVDSLLGEWECLLCESSRNILGNIA